MASLQYASDPEGDENNDDTFGTSMSGVGTLLLFRWKHYVAGWTTCSA